MQCVVFSGCFRDLLFITNFQQFEYECALDFFSSLSSLLNFLDMCIYSFLSNLENVLSLLLKIFLHSSPSHSPPTLYSNVFLFQLLSRVWLSAIPRTAACQASLSFTVSLSLLKLVSIEPVMPSIHFILCRPLLLLPSIFSSIRVFSSESE